MSTPDLPTRLLNERQILTEQVSAQRDQLERLQAIVDHLRNRLAHDEYLLAELDGVLGIAAQMRIESLSVRLRGQRLEEVAIAVLNEERGPETVVHYRDWFNLVRARGHHIAGKDPLSSFLTQINRSTAIERIGSRTGRYRLKPAASPS